MKRIVIFVLCGSLVFGAVALPTFLGSTFSLFTNVAEFATELLLPATVNPENVPLSKEVALKINAAIGRTVVDVSNVQDGANVDGVVITNNLYKNTLDGWEYIIIRKITIGSKIPVVGSLLTMKVAIPAAPDSLGVAYSIVGPVGVSLYVGLLSHIKPFSLQETNINTINWIEENW